MKLIPKNHPLLEYQNLESKTTRLFILWQKLSNIPEQFMIRHNRKYIRDYDNRFPHNYDITNSSLNIAIKTSKQPNIDNCRK